MANIHDIGDEVRIWSTFETTATGDAVDPTTVTLVVKPPSGAASTYTYAAAQITKTATGAYEKVISPSTSGIYRYRWTSTGTGAGSEESWFEVRARRVV